MAFGDLLGEASGTITQGQGKLSGIAAARLKPQIIEGVLYEFGEISPFYVFLLKLGLKKTVGAPTFGHYQSDELPLSVEIDNAAGYVAGDTSLQLATGHASRVVVGDRLMVTRTGIG